MAREQARFDRPDRRQAPAPAPPVVERCQVCGDYAGFFIGPPAQAARERWCGRCVPDGFFTWGRSTRG